MKTTNKPFPSPVNRTFRRQPDRRLLWDDIKRNGIRFLALALVLSCFPAVSCKHTLGPRADEKAAAYARVKDYVDSCQVYQIVLSPEGEFITVFNEQVVDWVKQELNAPLLKEIRTALAPYLPPY